MAEPAVTSARSAVSTAPWGAAGACHRPGGMSPAPVLRGEVCFWSPSTLLIAPLPRVRALLGCPSQRPRVSALGSIGERAASPAAF